MATPGAAFTTNCRRFVCVLLALLYALQISAQSDIDTLELRQQLASVEADLQQGELDPAQLEQHVVEVNQARSRIGDCVAAAEAQLQTLNNNLAALDLGDDDNAADVFEAELRDIKSSIQSQKKIAIDCQLLANRVDAVLQQLTEYKGSMLVSRLQQNSRTAMAVLKRFFAERNQVLGATMEVVRKLSGGVWDALARQRGLLYLCLVAVLLGAYLSFIRRTQVLGLQSEQGYGNFDRFRLAMREAIYRMAFVLLPLSVASLYWLLFPPANNGSTALIKHLCYLLTMFFWASVVIRATLEPGNTQWVFAPIQPKRRHALAQRIRVLLGLVFISLLFSMVAAQLPESMAHFIRLCIMLGLAGNLIWLIWLIDSLERFAGRSRKLRGVLVSLLLVTGIAEIGGYLNFSAYLLQGFIGTLLAISILWLLNEFTREVFDGLDTGQRRWHRAVRKKLAVAADAHVPGLLWFRFFSLIVVWGLAAVVFLQAWELLDVSWAWFRRLFEDGFAFGETQIIPAKILLGVLLFALLLMLANSFKNKVVGTSSLLARFESSARETVLTLIGYAGFMLALIIGLSMAGFSFQNLAIVAGALSVGIGFGLQNIVNNFVSGIILLFERPIRRGDWVVVGGTEGVVKNIRVRSTEIETFDRSDVVVPNSEFISQQVVNWTLNDPHGRVIVPVGVAYGSDTAMVREILLKVAHEHPDVIQENNFRNLPMPRVLFMGFGDSALNFELRCFIRDIRNWPFVRSDLNFEIDRSFRAAGISIPFPQRDVHIIGPQEARPPDQPGAHS